MPFPDALLLVACAALATAILIPLLERPALRAGLVDVPGGRKQHEGPVPLIGGIAMALAFGLCALVLAPGALGPFRFLFAGVAVLAFVGALDDMHDLSARTKFAIQTVVVVIAALAGNQVRVLGDLLGLGVIGTSWFAVPFTALAMMAFINGLNMIDGVDGLAGTNALVTTLWLAACAAVLGRETELKLLLLLAGALVGFLAFNLRAPWRKRARVFMGDAGSMAVGFALAWLAVALADPPGGGVPPIVIPWIIALPFFDLVATMARRIKHGKNPMAPGRDHIHHLLADLRFNETPIVVILGLASIVLGAVGFLEWRAEISSQTMFYGFLACLCAYIGFARWVIRHAATWVTKVVS